MIADATVDNARRIFRRRPLAGLDLRRRAHAPSWSRRAIVTTRFGIDYVRLRSAKGATVSVPVQRGRELPSADMPDGIEILSGLRAGDVLVQP